LVDMHIIRLLVIMLISTFLLGQGAAEAGNTELKKWDLVKGDYPSSTDLDVGANAGGVVWSRHNLSSYGPFIRASANIQLGPLPVPVGEGCSWNGSQWINCQLPNQVATTQICVFCHTPHHSKTDTGPLWNKDNVATYTSYGSTVAGNSTAVSGSSLACLSCHDGVSTFDSFINRPGQGSNTDGSASDMNWSFSMWSLTPGAPNAQHKFDHFRADAGSCNLCHSQERSDRANIGLGDSFTTDYMVATGLPLPFPQYAPANSPVSGTADLANDHPIGVTYTEKVASLRPLNTRIATLMMYNAKSLDPSSTVSYGRSDNYWSVFGYINEGATIQDLLRGDNKVECASCHDPHYKNQTNDDPGLIRSYTRTSGATCGANPDCFSSGFNRVVTAQDDELIDGLFLRRVGGNSNSGVCRTCHNK
jgi:hypothetical protein